LSSPSPDNDSLDLAMDEVVETSIEQLYYNICEMQSSDHSPSRRSFVSYGEESRIDSELRFLAGGDYDTVEEIKEIVEETNTPEGGKVQSPVGISSEENKKSVLRSKASKGRPPNGKPAGRRLKTLSKVASFNTGKNALLPERSNLQNGSNGPVDKRYLGPYLLKQARELMGTGDNPQKALALSLRAKKVFELSAGDKPDLEYVMCLHVVSALYCRLGRYSEAISILEKSIDVPVMDLGQSHALAKFAGCMQLGDTYAMLGQIENSILFYTAGLEIQRQVLGEKDPRYAETCRYLAEAHVQAMQFEEAEKLCETSLSIHKENGLSASPEEAADRRLLGLIQDAKGDHLSALEHFVLASMAMAANGHHEDVASIDCNIGDAYLSLARYDEAIFAYQKALNMFKTSRGENHLSVASVFIRLADLYNKIGKLSESKSYCENALRIYLKPIPGTPPEEIASGLVDISAIYESANEPEMALELLRKAMEKYGDPTGGQQGIIAGIEAQIGVLYFVLGKFSEAYGYLKSSTANFRSIGDKKSAVFGIALNQMGLVCLQLMAINEAADLFEESRSILEAECGPYHADTLRVCSNLASTYDAMGRTGDAIELLEYVVELREEKLGTANPEVEDERRRLDELLKETGLSRRRRTRSLGALLVKNSGVVH
ncbi:hypothetical protein M569_04228, partial [Genlisea aurea]